MLTMPTKTTLIDIRYEHIHIDMTDIFPNLFAKIISFTLPYSINPHSDYSLYPR